MNLCSFQWYHPFVNPTPFLTPSLFDSIPDLLSMGGWLEYPLCHWSFRQLWPLFARHLAVLDTLQYVLLLHNPLLPPIILSIHKSDTVFDIAILRPPPTLVALIRFKHPVSLARSLAFAHPHMCQLAAFHTLRYTFLLCNPLLLPIILSIRESNTVLEDLRCWLEHLV